MARKRRFAECERCGRRFELCRYNAHRQKYCTVESCVRERRREEQRTSYREKYRNDAAFRQSERARCRAGIRRRRAEKAAAAPPCPTARLNLELVTSGLLAQLLDSNDPLEVLELACALERRGRQLAASAHLGRPRPGELEGNFSSTSAQGGKVCSSTLAQGGKRLFLYTY